MVNWLGLSVFTWVLSIVIAASMYFRCRTRKPSGNRSVLHLLVLGTAVSIFLSELPRAFSFASSDLLSGFNAMLVSVYYTAQVFTSGADTDLLLIRLSDSNSWVERAMVTLVVAMHTAAPILLITAVLSYFQTPTSVARLLVRFRRDINLFSELNAHTIALAESLRKHHPTDAIVFANVAIGASYPTPELIARTRSIGSICFKTDLLSVPLVSRPRKTLLRVFIFGEDEDANAEEARELLLDIRFGQRRRTDLYVLSSGLRGDLLLPASSKNTCIRLRRVNLARSMIYDWLWRDPIPGHSAGVDLFRKLISTPVVSAAIVGLDSHGIEMLRALSWYCRMELEGEQRVRLELEAFDNDPAALNRLQALCPGLFTGRREALIGAETSIEVFGGIDTGETDLRARLSMNRNLDFVFVSLGDDSRNMEFAIELFRECVRQGGAPQILVITKSSRAIAAALTDELEEARAATGGQTLPTIHLMGDVSMVMSYDSILRSEMELNGLACHLRWADQSSQSLSESISGFWRSNYNYSSSIAVPIHWKARRFVGTPGSNKPASERSPGEHATLRRLEHDRWCSFMLSEGFVPGRFKGAYLVRTHPLLVPFGSLEQPDQVKDDNDSIDALEALKLTQNWRIAREDSQDSELILRIESAVMGIGIECGR